MTITARPPISREGEELTKRYQLALDAFSELDADKDGRLSLGKEVKADAGLASLIDNKKNDKLVTIIELFNAFGNLDTAKRFLELAPVTKHAWTPYFRIKDDLDEMDVGVRSLMIYFMATCPESNEPLHSNVGKLGELADAYIKAAVRADLPLDKIDHLWILEMMSGDGWKDQGTMPDRALDIMTEWLSEVDTIEELRYFAINVDTINKSGGPSAIVKHYNIVNGLDKLAENPPPTNVNHYLLFNKDTLEIRMVAVKKGERLQTNKSEIIAGKYVWDERGEGTVFCIPNKETLLPWAFKVGHTYLFEQITAVMEYIKANQITSIVDPTKLISDIDPTIIWGIIIAENSGPRIFDASRTTAMSDMNGLFFDLGRRGTRTYENKISSQGARGLCQLTEGPYLGLVTTYGHIDPDFVRGTKDHFNSILAQVMYLDKARAGIEDKIDERNEKKAKKARKSLEEPGKLGDLLSLFYNTGYNSVNWLFGLTELNDYDEESIKQVKKFRAAEYLLGFTNSIRK